MTDKLVFFRPRLSFSRKQSGIALFVCLLFTLMITMVAVVSIQGETLNERIAGNARDKTLAFQAAEVSLRVAETLMASPAGAAIVFDNTKGFYNSTDGVYKDWQTIPASNWAVYPYVELPHDIHLSKKPQYIVELLPEDLFSDDSLIAGKPIESTDKIYRITSVGTGSSDNSIVVLQSVYRWN